MGTPHPRPETLPQTTNSRSLAALMDRFFEITARGSTFGREVRGGFATFFTMSYIVVLNPLIIGTVADADGHLLGGGQNVASSTAAVAGVTALAAGVLTILMGVVGRYPFALAAGLGINSFIAASVVPRMSWPDAMGLVVIEGVIITVLVLTKVRTALLHAIPSDLKTAISVGIGLFIAVVGLVDAGFVRRIPDAANTTVPVGLGMNGDLRGWPIVVFVIGLLLTAVLVMRKVSGAIIIGIVVSTLLAVIVEAVFHPGPAVVDGKLVGTGWQLNVPSVPSKVLSPPDLSLLGKADLFGGFDRVGVLAALMIVFALALSDFFDTMGTVVGLSGEARLLRPDGSLPGVGYVLFVDSVAAAAGGLTSSSSNTTYIESAAGIGEGARTGVANLVTGALFLATMFFAPVVAVVPFEAASPALVIVGLAMVSQIRRINFSDMGVAIPVLLTAVLMPFTFSITAGLGAGIISYTVLQVFQGRRRTISPLLWIAALLFVVYFAEHLFKQLLGIG